MGLEDSSPVAEADPAALVALVVAWDEAVVGLANRGWAMIPNALDGDVLRAVTHDDRRQWRLLGDEGVVRQHAYGAYLPLAEALPEVRSLAAALVADLSTATVRAGLPKLPELNEVTWGRYPAGVGGISAHRDPDAYGGVIAVFTLWGRATFRILDGGYVAAEWDTGPGQLALLRGRGRPCADSVCPVHEAVPPAVGDRGIMTFRHNLSGAGAGYTV